MTFDKIRSAALALPDVEEGTAWGFPAFRTRKKMFVCFRTDLKSIVVIGVSFEERDAMIEEDPVTYYTTDHHRNYPCVLARTLKLRADALDGLLQTAWRAATAKGKAPKRRAAR